MKLTDTIIERFRKKFGVNLWKQTSYGFEACNKEVEGFIVSQLQILKEKVEEMKETEEK